MPQVFDLSKFPIDARVLNSLQRDGMTFAWRMTTWCDYGQHEVSDSFCRFRAFIARNRLILYTMQCPTCPQDHTNGRYTRLRLPSAMEADEAIPLGPRSKAKDPMYAFQLAPHFAEPSKDGDIIRPMIAHALDQYKTTINRIDASHPGPRSEPEQKRELKKITTDVKCHLPSECSKCEACSVGLCLQVCETNADLVQLINNIKLDEKQALKLNHNPMGAVSMYSRSGYECLLCLGASRRVAVCAPPQTQVRQQRVDLLFVLHVFAALPQQFVPVPQHVRDGAAVFAHQPETLPPFGRE